MAHHAPRTTTTGHPPKSRGPAVAAALEVRTGRLIEIEAGEAERLRQLCRAGELVCPLVGCEAPELTTVRGFRNRWGTLVPDTFRHLRRPRDPFHAKESLRHFASKFAVAAWLADCGADDVRVERTVRVNTARRETRRRRPDVSGNFGPHRVAIEIQVSRLAETEWRARTRGLESVGYRVAWLWAWTSQTETVAATTALRALAASGAELWFLDIGARGAQLGRAFREERVGQQVFRLHPHGYSGSVRIDWQPIETVRMAFDATLFDPTKPAVPDQHDEWQSAKRAADQRSTDLANSQAIPRWRPKTDKDRTAMARAEKAAEAERQRQARTRGAIETAIELRANTEESRVERLIRQHFGTT
jgi:hypothetical protein